MFSTINNFNYAMLKENILEIFLLADYFLLISVMTLSLLLGIIIYLLLNIIGYLSKFRHPFLSKMSGFLKTFVVMDAAQKKEQFCYHFDRHYSPAELSKYKEDPLLTKYLNENSNAAANINRGFALVRGLAHKEEMERIIRESDKAFAELEERLKNKK